MMKRILMMVLGCLAFASGYAQQALGQRPNVKSPVVNQDGTVTFNFFDPTAQQVSVTGDFEEIHWQTLPMTRQENGVWTVTTQPLNPELYSYLTDSLQWLDAREEGYANFPTTFLIRLSRFLGFWPDTEEAATVLREGETSLVPLLLRMDFATMHLFRFTREQRTRLLEVLNDYYRLHIPHFPELRSMAILREVLS